MGYEAYRQLLGELDKEKRLMILNETDFWLCLFGKEGSGKSNIAYLICKHLDPHFTLERNAAFTVKRFINLMDELPPFSAIWVDEAAFVMFSRNWQTTKVKDIVSLAKGTR